MDTKERFHIEIFDREELVINQVSHILRFDEESLTLMTSYGKILIEGKDLKIENLNHENGSAHIRGIVYSLYFSKKEAPKGKANGEKRT